MFALTIWPIVVQFIIVIVANFPQLQLGLSISWISPVLVKIRDQNQTILYEPITDEEVTWLVSLSTLVGLIAMPFAGPLSNSIGRKLTIVVTTIPRLTACVLLFFISRAWMLLLIKCLCGLSDVIQVSICTTYSSEIASKEIRGALGIVSQLISSLGAMLMLTIGPFVSFESLNIIYTCVVFGTTIPILFLPETPYFLYAKGQVEKSVKLLIYLRGSEILAQEEILEYSRVDQTKLAFKDLFKDKFVLKTIGKVIVLGLCSQIFGYNPITLYLQTIFNSTHTNISSEMSSLIIGCIQMLAGFCTILLTDRVGRKPILYVTSVGCFIGMIGLGTFFKLAEDVTNISGFTNYIPLISIALIMFCYNAGIGSIVFALAAELFDGKYRAVGVSIGVFVAALSAFIIAKFFDNTIQAIGPSWTYYSFAGGCVFSGVFVAFFINETKGKLFSEIQTEMGRKYDDDLMPCKEESLGSAVLNSPIA